MKFLNHLDLVENEARRLKMYRVAASAYTPSINTSGNIILDTAAGIPKWWDQTGNSGSGIWRDFAYGTASISNWTVQSDNGTNIQVDTGETVDFTGGAALVTTTSGTATAPVVTFDVQTYGVMSATTTATRAGDGTDKIFAVERHPTTDKLQVRVPYDDHKATTFTLTADSGTNQTISDGNTMDIAGGTGTSTVVGATDTVTVNANTFAANNSANAAEQTGDTNTKWYGVQTDSNNKLVVHVPWTDSTPSTTWTLRDDDNDDVSISNGKFVKFVTSLGSTAGSHGTNITGSGTTGAPYVVTTEFSEMTASTLGFGKHAYDTQFTGTIEELYGGGDGFANDRVYGVIGNSSGQLCVHVPWVDTDNNTDVDVSNANLLTRLANLESSGGAADEDIVIGADSGDTIVITGNLKVSGTTTTVDSTVVNIADNIITLNSNVTGTPSSNAGIEVERGNLSNVGITWTENNDVWYLTEATNQTNGGTLVSKKIIQNLFSTVSTQSGNVSVSTPTTTLTVNGANGITTSASGSTVSISGGTGITPTAVATITSSGINASTNKIATITHNLGTKDIVVRLYYVDGEGAYEEIYANVDVTSTSVCKVTFSANLTDNVRAVVMGANNASSITPTYS